jgi:hypothetical protein
VEGTEEKKEEWGCTFVKMAGGEKKMLMSWRKRKKPMVTCEKPWKTHEKNNGKPVGEKNQTLQIAEAFAAPATI